MMRWPKSQIRLQLALLLASEVVAVGATGKRLVHGMAEHFHGIGLAQLGVGLAFEGLVNTLGFRVA